MMSSFKQLWSNLRSSFWFVPTLMVAASTALAVALVGADSTVSDKWLAHWPRLFGATPAGARQMVATIAGSIMTVMGVTFSMTLVALALASSQYTSRILRNFMRSRVTQSTFGILASIFTYCLIVQHTIRGGVGEAVFVPGLAVFFAFVLALGGVVVLIYFVHHIASSIQASSIIAAVARETIAAVDRLLPEQLGNEPDGDVEQALSLPEETTWHLVVADVDGYIQDVDSKALLRLARDGNAVVRMERGIGDFVVRGVALAALAREDPPDQDTVAALHASYSIGIHRTVEKDPAFGVRQIVDIALKALSPGVNDTSTALICIDHLTAILTRLVAREFPALHQCDGDEVRLVALGPTFEDLLGEAFDQIRRNAQGNVTIMARLLGALDVIASQTDRPLRRCALREQVKRIAELAEHTIDSAHDRAEMRVRPICARNALRTSARR